MYRQWVNLPPDQLYATIGVSRGRAELTVEWPEPDKGDIPIKNVSSQLSLNIASIQIVSA